MQDVTELNTVPEKKKEFEMPGEYIAVHRQYYQEVFPPSKVIQDGKKEMRTVIKCYLVRTDKLNIQIVAYGHSIRNPRDKRDIDLGHHIALERAKQALRDIWAFEDVSFEKKETTPMFVGKQSLIVRGYKSYACLTGLTVESGVISEEDVTKVRQEVIEFFEQEKKTQDAALNLQITDIPSPVVNESIAINEVVAK